MSNRGLQKLVRPTAKPMKPSTVSAVPLPDLLVVLAAAQYDATNVVASTTTRGGDNLLAVSSAIQSLYLPYVRLDLRILELLDGLHHQACANFQIVGSLVAFDLIELRLLRWHQQREHESAVTGC